MDKGLERKHSVPFVHEESYEYQSGILQGILLRMSGRKPYGSGPETLHLQPAVSQAVRQLEKEAGAKLFSRTSKGVLLTREGELLYH